MFIEKYLFLMHLPFRQILLNFLKNGLAGQPEVSALRAELL